MLRIAVFLTLLGVSLQSASNVTLEGPDELIFGGSPAAAGQYPFFVSLQVNGYWHDCGGALISNRHVITAGHCIWSPQSAYRYAYQAEQAYVQSYAVRMGTNLHSGGVSYRVAWVKIHPYFNRVNLYNDVAIIGLAAPVQFNNLVQPIRLMRGRAGPQQAMAIGLGFMRFDPRTRPPSSLSPTTLQQLPVTIDADYTCRTQLFPIHMRDFTMCIKGSQPRSGPLPGDSGSPLVVKRGNVWWQAGICSFGDYMAYIKGMSGGVIPPTGYVRISSYCPFIAQVTRNMAYCQ
ncbi:hypothetical protein QR680_011771 [Steinernema hermaphroditum]|uniref:Peptidase S1 domain-containing protein n=1 Tax=Steinernema hermaphroditum TaxID=289476 RepID=A0AA39LZA9_9BILA|nr:hypothetical protein QR680_011771 [Steinernema hermaphroditum]